MEEEQELKHVCKFCSKSFSCGRSLGGHMRSHMINDITAQADGTKLTKKKLPSLVTTTTTNGETSNSYVLRENPKKTWRIPSDQETSVLERTCKECGKVFQSWKALFGHMKCHSPEREKLMIMEQEEQQQQEQEEEELDSWTSVMDSQSDNETAAAPNRKKKKRSQRRTRPIIGTTANSCSSVTEIEQEQEEVAICLMMLSRDVGGMNNNNNNNNSVAAAESSDNNSVFLENKNAQIGETARKTEHSVSEFSRKASKKKKSQQDDESSVVENYSGLELGKKRRLIDSSDPERNSRFECTTCNKIFHSYQALGGHRASHKKNKGCYASSGENSIETVQLSSPDPDETKLVITKSIQNDKEKMSKGHGCPICFKVFPSGQALGGHKRSHLVAASSINEEAKSKQNQSLAIQEPPIRDFLDLNLPAPAEEDNSNGLLGFNQWWIASSHKHESLVGLISN